MLESTIKNFRLMRQKSRNQTAAQVKAQGKVRRGLAQREIAESQQRTRQAVEGKIKAWYDEIDSIRQQRAADLEQSTTGALSEEMRPVARYESEFRGTITPPENLREDTEFTSAVSGLASKYNISESEVYAIIKGESSFNPQAQNPSGATGLFQFMPDVAKELGTNTQAILSMSPREQVELYDRYLQRWNYAGENRLGIMQAAPAYASKGPDEVIYDVDSAAWRQNPGWRELNDGPITVRSINNYYAKRES